MGLVRCWVCQVEVCKNFKTKGAQNAYYEVRGNNLKEKKVRRIF